MKTSKVTITPLRANQRAAAPPVTTTSWHQPTNKEMASEALRLAKAEEKLTNRDNRKATRALAAILKTTKRIDPERLALFVNSGRGVLHALNLFSAKHSASSGSSFLHFHD